MKMPKFNICVVAINSHWRIFKDTIDILKYSITELGYECEMSFNELKEDSINILVGSTLFAAQMGKLEYLDGFRYVIYQQEQLDFATGILPRNINYINILKNSSYIFEYSPSGMELLRDIGLENKSSYLPIGYHNSLIRHSNSQNQIKDIDVLFFGSYSERRKNIIDGLKERGVNAVHAFGVYDKDLWDIIIKSKIILNIHNTDGINKLETVRLAPLLANRCFVISEQSDHNPYYDGVVFSHYDCLVEICMHYLGDPDGRHRLALMGEEQIKKTNFRGSLKSIIGSDNFLKRVGHKDSGEMFPAQVINLGKDTARWSGFVSRNSARCSFERYQASDGNALDRSSLVREGLIDEGLSWGAGTIGCAISHVRLWQHSVNEKKTVTIFEDDALLHENFTEEAEQIIGALGQNWDIIFWGYLCNPAFIWLNFSPMRAEMRFYGERIGENHMNNKIISNPRTVRVSHLYGTHAYSITPKGAEILLKTCLPLRDRLIPFPDTGIVTKNEGIDAAMNAAYPEMRAYCCLPLLAIQSEQEYSSRLEIDNSIKNP